MRSHWLAVVFFLAACTKQPASDPNSDVQSGDDNSGNNSTDGTGTPVTWYKDVLPIVQEHCQECHSPGSIGPFALQDFEQGQARANLIASVVKTRSMPPWMPSEDCQAIANSRRLSQIQIDTIVNWVSGGALAGNITDAPPPPQARGELPWIDATLDPGVDYVPNNSGPDDYRCFMLDPDLTEARDVIGIDIQPGIRSMVHHVALYDSSLADARAADNVDAKPGWECFGGPGTSNPNMIGGWAPGSTAVQYPADTGVPLGINRVLVMQVHYNLENGIPLPDRTKLKLQFSRERVTYPAKIYGPINYSFLIPARTADYTSYGLLGAVPSPLRVWGAFPHMHTRGKKLRLETTGAASQCLVDIPNWDFHWQQMYLYREPVAVAAGSNVKVTCTWDNPTDQAIHFGNGTSDEMCIGYLYITH